MKDLAHSGAESASIPTAQVADTAPSAYPPVVGLNSVCDDMFERWDTDMRAGKLLLALKGDIKNYDPRVTRVRDALEAQPELEAALAHLVRVVRAAGIPALMRGVELGAVSWAIKADAALEHADRALAAATPAKAPVSAQTGGE